MLRLMLVQGRVAQPLNRLSVSIHISLAVNVSNTGQAFHVNDRRHARLINGDILDGKAVLIAQLPEPFSKLTLPYRQAGAAHCPCLHARTVWRLPTAARSRP
jgi:hypothetical protein